jgi:TRAP-type uncharacterized transport system substrate-binding protein
MNIARWTTVVAAVAFGAVAFGASAQQMQFFRIGTGGTAGTYYPLAGVIANAVSNPPGSRACSAGGSCGVPGLVATAVATNGSVANVNGISRRQPRIGLLAIRRRVLGLHGDGHLRGQAESRGAARHRQPLPRELPPGGAQGQRHQGCA